jgi:hypothetical protein
VTNPLETLLAPSAPVAFDPGPGSGEPTWFDAGDWRVYARLRDVASAKGDVVATFALPSGDSVCATRDPSGGAVSLPFSLTEAYTNTVTEAWMEAMKPTRLSARQLGLFYRVRGFVPRRAQLAARRLLMRRQGRQGFPAWPVDETVARLLRFYARCLLLSTGATEARFRWFWPDGYDAAAILTHDVESAEGLRLALKLADVEEQRGFRSSFNIVASWYPIDEGILRELRSRGFELGVHGVYHDRSMFSSRESFLSQLPRVREFAEQIGAVGFRSPAVHRVNEWLGELPVDYDCTLPHSDPYEPQPGGCCSVWPFFLGDVVELPWTLTQDHTLFTLLRQTSIEAWRDQVERIEAMNGLVQCLTHPDPGYLGDGDKRARYGELLDFLGERPGLWRALPREVAGWWKLRSGAAEHATISYGTARLIDGGVELARDAQTA